MSDECTHVPGHWEPSARAVTVPVPGVVPRAQLCRLSNRWLHQRLRHVEQMAVQRWGQLQMVAARRHTSKGWMEWDGRLLS